MTSLLKKINKLRSMSNREIMFRIRDSLLGWYEHLHFRLDRSRASGANDSADNHDFEHTDIFNQPDRDRFFTEMIEKGERLELIQSHLEVSTWIDQAEQVTSGKIQLLGHTIAIPFSGGWQTDPLEGKPWPDCFYAHVKNQRQVRNWDIKYVWEVNRHQYLIVLGKAFWLTRDERYAQKVISVIDTWIDENPFHAGVNWTSSLELAVRTLSWIWSSFLCRDSKHMTPAFQHKISASIAAQARYIENHLSYYSSPYNHLIGEAAALHVIGSLFPMLKRAEHWEELGWSIMADRIGEQFHEDGMSVEQASFYHHFTLGFYLQSIFLRRHNGKTIPENVMERMEKALEFSLHLTKPDGTLPMLGDIDNARSLYFNLTHNWDFRSFLSLGAVLFDRPDFKMRSPKEGGEELLWLASQTDLDTFESMNAAVPASTSIAFRKSGYFISRDKWAPDANYLCFDCGEIAAGLSANAIPSAAHGHADALSIELAAKGQSFIVDGGFNTYFGNIDWHRHFRQEEAHNTVRIGKRRQAEYCGRLTWQHVKRPGLLHWESTDDFDAMAGRLQYDDVTCHTRQIAAVKSSFWVVRDIVQAATDEKICSFLHFLPGVELNLDSESGQLIATRGNAGLIIKYSNNTVVSVEKGGTEPDSGWVSFGYGIKQPAWRAKFSWEASSNDTRSTQWVMIPFDLNHDPVLLISGDENREAKENTTVFTICGTRYSATTVNNHLYRFTIDRREINVDFKAKTN